MTKVDIFSGFLGAGKTTLIKKLISEAYDKDEQIVLIENEFGEIGVDTGFLRDSGIQINEMTAGCICCTLVGDFGKALNEVIEKYSPDRILIEPSGVGKLSDVIIAVQDINNEKIELNSFTTVVDAKRYKSYMRNFGEFYKNQVEHASAIFFSHQQELTDEQLEECLKFVEELNPDANIVTTDWNELSGDKMLEIMEGKKTLNSELEKLREEAHEELEAHEHEHHHHHHHHDHDDDEHECCCGHHHDHDDEDEEHEHEHEHHHHHHHDDDDDEEECSCGCGHHHHHHGHDADEVFDEFGTKTANKYEMAEIQAIIDDLDECGEVLRAKGIVENAEGGWIEFDYVPGEGEVRATDAEATGMIVVIGTRINKEKIREMFKL
ncbi:MAG: GTP-binding protein [Mogibacterium sp.]|nr:GTP-binding protein [Mogibacterium sp.]